MIPTGRQIPLEHGDFRAVVTELGASLRELTWRDRPLVLGFGEDELPLAYQGTVLAPWPNRIADGRYRFQGTSYQLALTEPDRRNALHGLVLGRPGSSTGGRRRACGSPTGCGPIPVTRSRSIWRSTTG